METNQKLGIKVFFYYLSKRIVIGIVVLVASIFISSSKASIISLFSSFLSNDIASSLVDYIIGGFFTVSVLLIIFGVFMSWLSYISCVFTLGENAISIKRGILNKKDISIPYRQIQDISIEQSFSNKMMGVSKLVILTAGNDNNDTEGEAEGSFDVIDSNLAQNIKETILQKTNTR